MAAVSLVPEGQAASFDMLALGSGGGPLEDDLSAYWVKPKKQDWKDGFVSVDGGSCLGALRRLLEERPGAFDDFQTPQNNNASTAGYIYGLMTSFLVTHAHWDHISGLVLSSGSGAGQKSVYGSKQTLSNLSSAMNGGLWPVLGSYEEKNGVPYVWRLMEENKRVVPSLGLSATIFPCSHGRHHGSTSYESSAFFIENEENSRSFLMFGDVEADSVSGETTNRRIWQEAARRIQKRTLSSIFIECSYSSSRRKDQLYGHLSPPYILEELQVLASLVPPLEDQAADDLTGRLKGINIGIVHVKEPTSTDETPDSTNGQSQDSTFTTSSEASSTTQSEPSPATPSDLPLPAAKKRKVANASTPRKTRSANKIPQTGAISASQDPDGLLGNIQPTIDIPEGIKAKILRELLELEETARLGVRFVMLEQGMRIEL